MTAANHADRLLLGGLLAFVLAITVYMASAPPLAIYSVGAQRAVAEFARYSTRELRVKGLLVPGSVHQHHSGADCGLDFLLLDQGQRFRGTEIGSRLCRHYRTGDFCPICDHGRQGH
jgi:hypothetical protein